VKPFALLCATDPEDLGINLFKAAIAQFTTGAPLHNSASPASKLINLSFSLIILLVLSAYTANLASLLVTARGHSFSAEVRAADASACSHRIPVQI
jgi:hypothetical protein